MKPKVLQIEGLNSFEEKQIIYFDKLTEKGLFGIFGPTGSGKSTILDAITLALYGSVARENKGYINTTKKSLTVSYEFEIGTGEERITYIAERNLRINKNGGYNTKYARLKKKEENGEVIIAEGPSELEKQVEQIIGLTADDFTRSVVIPQGKFSDFLKLKGKDKRDMLERIFNLEKYGNNLVEKIKKIRNIYIKEENILAGEGKKYEGLTEEKVEKMDEQLKKSIEEEKTIRSEKKRLDLEYEKYKDIWELQKELNEYKLAESKLNDNLSNISIKKEKLKKAEKALKVKPLIDELYKIISSLEENSKDLKQCGYNLEKTEETLKITEEAYNKVLKEKEEILPSLIIKRANLTRAIELKKSLENLKAEKDVLKSKYINTQREKKCIDDKIKQISVKKEEVQKEIELIDVRLSEIRVEPEYREKVQKALDKENEYKQCLERKNVIALKVVNREDSIKGLSKEHEKIILLQKEANNKLKDLESKAQILEKSNTGDSNLLINKSEMLNSCKEKLEKTLVNVSKKNELRKKLEELDNSKNDATKKLAELKEKQEDMKSELTKIKADVERINKINLASILAEELKEGEPCPVCGSIHHINKPNVVDKEYLVAREIEKDNIEKAIDELNSNINETTLSLLSIEKEEERAKDEYNEILKNLEGIDVEKLKDEKEREEREFINLKESIERYKIEKEKLDKEIIYEKDNKMNIDMKEAKLSEMLKGESNVFSEQKDELLKESERASSLLEEYNSIKSELNIQNADLRLKEINSLEKEAQRLQKLQREKRSLIETMDKEKEELTLTEKKLDFQLGQITQSGIEKKEIINEKEEEIKKLSEGMNPEEYLKDVEKNISDITKNSDILKQRLEDEKNRKQEIFNRKLSLEEANRILTSNLEEQNEKLDISLRDNEFNTKEEVLQVVLDETTMNKMRDEIACFEDELKNVKSNIIRIENKLNGEFIEDEKWDELKNNRLEKEKLLDSKIKEIATMQKTINDLKNELEELKALNKKAKEIEHKLSLLNDLTKLLEGNRFVEFVAMNQLKYIAREASRRLKSITKERYALEIDDEGNFTIRDDFNGGEIRDTSTLSGGETFLTSLALALALSTQVQLKGNATLEFFFLDEGFGTLDSELLDTVMTSLERLHNSRLSVGIISHVEELKNRVPVKLIVTPSKPGEGGSKVSLEYS